MGMFDVEESETNMKDTEETSQKMEQGGQTSGPEVSRRQEMRHDGLTKERADTINADQSAATFVTANNARSGDQTGVWPVRGADDEFPRQGPIVNHCIATLNRYLDNHRLIQLYSICATDITKNLLKLYAVFIFLSLKELKEKQKNICL